MVCQPESIERSLEAAANFGSGGLSPLLFSGQECPKGGKIVPPLRSSLLSLISRATNVRRFFPLLFQVCLPAGHFLISVWRGGQWKNKILKKSFSIVVKLQLQRANLRKKIYRLLHISRWILLEDGSFHFSIAARAIISLGERERRIPEKRKECRRQKNSAEQFLR